MKNLPRNVVAPVPPHPGPLPWGEGEYTTSAHDCHGAGGRRTARTKRRRAAALQDAFATAYERRTARSVLECARLPAIASAKEGPLALWPDTGRTTRSPSPVRGGIFVEPAPQKIFSSSVGAAFSYEAFEYVAPTALRMNREGYVSTNISPLTGLKNRRATSCRWTALTARGGTEPAVYGKSYGVRRQSAATTALSSAVERPHPKRFRAPLATALHSRNDARPVLRFGIWNFLEFWILNFEFSAPGFTKMPFP
jgi:hypothetical protein